ncbi:hypothetical protein, partial [Nocardia gipuzkoensis]
LRELELAPLSLVEAAEALGERPDSPVVRVLHSESGGNPFYLEQLARTSKTGLPDRMTGAIVGTEVGAGIPPVLRTMITQELSGLTIDALDVLQAGAVAGDPFDVDLVTAIAESGKDRVLKSLDELVVIDLVRPTATPGQFRFRHPIVRRVVYDQTLPGRRFTAHKQAARALAQRGASLGTRAHHIEQSATPGDEQAIITLAEAAQTVLPRAPAAAARWLETALRLLPPASGPEQRLPLLITQASALAYAGQLHASRTKLQQALERIPTESVGDRAGIIGMIARADHGLGQAEEARHLLVAALAETPEGSADAVPLELALAENCFMRRQWAEAVEVASRAREQADALGDTGLVIASSALLALMTNHLGNRA